MVKKRHPKMYTKSAAATFNIYVLIVVGGCPAIGFNASAITNAFAQTPTMKITKKVAITVDLKKIFSLSGVVNDGVEFEAFSNSAISVIGVG